MRSILLTLLILTPIATASLVKADAPAPVTRLEARLAATVTAGEVAGLRVAADGPDGTAVDIVVIDALGAIPRRGILRDGTVAVQLPIRSTRTAGLVTVVATAGSLTDSAQLLVRPGPVVEPVVPLLGARSIVADGSDQAMVAIIPEDAFGNPQPDGHRVTVSIRRESGEQAAWSAPVTGGVAWTWIPSGTDAGQTLVGAGSGSRRGPAAYLQEVPGPPAAITVSADRDSMPADGRSLAVVETGELLDANGNRLLDGAAVQFTTTGPGGARASATASVVAGRASTIIQAPVLPGFLEVTASVAGVISLPAPITLTADVGTQAVPTAVRFGDDAVVVRIGPMLGADGSFVPDGTRVEAAGLGGERMCRTEAGACELRFPPDADGLLTIRVGAGSAEIYIGDGHE